MEELKRNIIKLVNSEDYRPMTLTEIAIELGLETTVKIQEVMRELIDDMYVIETKKGRIMAPDRAGLFIGKFISHRKGFGFVQSDREGVQDLYIQSKDVNGAIHNDRVMAEITRDASGDKRAEGRIVKVIKREVTKIVGTFKPAQHFGFVTPMEKEINTDIYIP